MDRMTKVIMETGENRKKMIRKALHELGEEFLDRVKAAKCILIKPNLVHHEIQLASTHIDAVRAVIEGIREYSAVPIVVADAGYTGTKGAFRNLGYDSLPEEYDRVKLRDLNDDEFVEGFSFKRDGSTNTIRRSKTAHDCDFRISLAPLKTHKDVSASLTIHNWVLGTWVVPPRISMYGRVWAHWPWLHEEGDWAHHKTIASLYQQLPVDLAILDGVQAMEGEGPVQGTSVDMGVVIAGWDAVAVDAVGATLMQMDPGSIGYLAMCAEEGMGSIDMTNIDVPPMLLMSTARFFARPTRFDQRHTAWQNQPED